MNKMKKITIVWGFMAVIIFGLLTCYGLFYKKKVKVYKDLENQLVEAAKKYSTSKFYYPDEGKTLDIDLSLLMESEIIDKFEVNEKPCDGYVVVSKSTVFSYKGYISCDNYKTKGYSK